MGNPENAKIDEAPFYALGGAARALRYDARCDDARAFTARLCVNQRQ